jgi:hypothetical protein
MVPFKISTVNFWKVERQSDSALEKIFHWNSKLKMNLCSNSSYTKIKLVYKYGLLAHSESYRIENQAMLGKSCKTE